MFGEQPGPPGATHVASSVSHAGPAPMSQGAAGYGPSAPAAASSIHSLLSTWSPLSLVAAAAGQRRGPRRRASRDVPQGAGGVEAGNDGRPGRFLLLGARSARRASDFCLGSMNYAQLQPGSPGGGSSNRRGSTPYVALASAFRRSGSTPFMSLGPGGVPMPHFLAAAAEAAGGAAVQQDPAQGWADAAGRHPTGDGPPAPASPRLLQLLPTSAMQFGRRGSAGQHGVDQGGARPSPNLPLHSCTHTYAPSVPPWHTHA
jgi:hypothetical protein